jgi:hypothetical protein
MRSARFSAGRFFAAACLSAFCAAAQTAPAPAAAPVPPAGQWQPMFDGKSLAGWKETPFTSSGKVTVENGTLILGTGYMTGVNWAGAFPKLNYEVRVEAARLQGSDFFAGITFPVGDTFCTWINGGWGGELVGLSSLDDSDASENETTSRMQFKQGQWYVLRLRVTDRAISAWIDEDPVIYVELANRTIGLRFGEIELSKPFGVASYDTKAAVRKIEYRLLPAAGEDKQQ